MEVIIATTSTQFVLTQSDQDYIMVLGVAVFIYLIMYRLFVDYFSL